MFEQITDAVAYHAEGPVWAKEWGGLRWVDMLEGDLLTLKDNGEIDRLHVGSPLAAFVRPRASVHLSPRPPPLRRDVPWD